MYLCNCCVKCAALHICASTWVCAVYCCLQWALQCAIWSHMYAVLGTVCTCSIIYMHLLCIVIYSCASVECSLQYTMCKLHWFGCTVHCDHRAVCKEIIFAQLCKCNIHCKCNMHWVQMHCCTECKCTLCASVWKVIVCKGGLPTGNPTTTPGCCSSWYWPWSRCRLWKKVATACCYDLHMRAPTRP